MCASDAQTTLENQQASFYTSLQSQDATVFGEDQNILNQVSATYSPILAAGPNQYGFSTAETNSLNTTATEGVATDYANANKALQENQAAQGGGNTYLPSGVSAQQSESLASSAAQQQATEQQQILQAGYTQGNTDFNNATTAMLGTAGLLNPDGSASTATSAGSAEGTTANQIASENESWMAPLIGAAGAIGSTALKVAVPGLSLASSGSSGGSSGAGVTE